MGGGEAGDTQFLGKDGNLFESFYFLDNENCFDPPGNYRGQQ